MNDDLTGIINFLQSISPWFVVKIFILILMVLYMIFAAVLNRQVTLMNHVLEAKFSPYLKLISLIHLLTVITAFLIALAYL